VMMEGKEKVKPVEEVKVDVGRTFPIHTQK
jgi:hypothetical protein